MSLADAIRDLAAQRVMPTLAEGLADRARGYTSRRTGALHDSITAETDGLRARVQVGAEYGRYQNEGTGIYGPNGQRIRPRRARALVFDWPAVGGIVFAASVAGSEPTRFWTKAVEEWPDIVREAGR